MEQLDLQETTPTAVRALRTVLQADFPDDLRADRITIQVLASGEVAYRLHPVGGGDYIGGVEVSE